MKLIFIRDTDRYNSIIKCLRINHDVDYVYMGCNKILKKECSNYEIPRLLGRYKGYKLMSFIIVNFLLFTKKYDFCIADYSNTYIPVIYIFIKKLFKNFFNTKFIHDLRTIPVDYPPIKKMLIEYKYRKRINWANKYYDGTSIITHRMKDYINTNYEKIRIKNCIWESGVDTKLFIPSKNKSLRNNFGYSDKDFLCFYHGSLALERGIIPMIESFSNPKLKNKKNIKLFILGGGNIDNKISRILSRYNLHDSVFLHGWVNQKSVPEFIAMADLCIVPLPDIDWWRISSPLKLMEYIACGKNILLSKIDANMDVVGYDTNYFYLDKITKNKIAQKIYEAYAIYSNSPIKYQMRGLNEREKHINKISWQKKANKLYRFLQAF